MVAATTHSSSPPAKFGDRVTLDVMAPGDPMPLPAGSTGTVHRVEPWMDGSWNVRILWDCGRYLGLIFPLDKFKVEARAIAR
jgi:Domain of unknown function (DUF4314)